MRSLSIFTHRGLVHWQMLLVAVSLFNFCCQPTTAQVSIVSNSFAEGETVLLPLHDIPPNVTAFAWYMEQSTDRKHMIAFLITGLTDDIKGPAYSGRQKINPDGSLQIDNATKNDTGMYTVVVYVTDVVKEIGLGWLIVYEPDLVVSINASNTTVTENKDTVVFTCNTNAVFYRWLFNGTKVQFNERLSLSKDYKSLIINPVKREDAGTYQCQGFNAVMSRESLPVLLHVNLNDTHFLT